MKKVLLILLLASTFLACKNKVSQTEENSISNTDSTQNLIEKFKPIIHGVWVKKDYIDLVIEKKSPAAASDKASGITVMTINTSSITRDSIVVSAGWGNHEGGNEVIKFKPGNKPNTILFNERESLGYEINKGDTILVLYQINEEDNKEYITKYIKALDKQPDDELGYGMDYLINKGLISGKYIATDSLGKNFNVTFLNNGKVFGFPNFKKYWIQNDLMGGEPMDNLDGIIFDIYTKKQSSYTFKINKDTLNLYDTYPNADSTIAIVGKLKYKFVRQK